MQKIESTKVLIGGVSQNQPYFESDLAELAELTKANNMQVVGTVRQNLDHVITATYFGSGKLAEIKALAAEKDAQSLILNDELTPSQIRNLEQDLKLPIIDRTRLILAIFANRAKSREAKLQVQIARLQYELPRLRIGEEANFMQQGGGPGFANRGSGETKLEMNQRTIKNKISQLRHELKAMNVSQQTKRQQRQRTNIPTVALVGYTNAGKSTTMNGLLRLFNPDAAKTVFERDMLFATLDTSVREITLPTNQKFLLSDTVGFINKLPTQLVKAFRSTLAEAANADLLIQVIDFSDPHYEEMAKVTDATLRELQIADIPMIYAYNKADRKPGTQFPLQTGEHDLVYAANDQTSLKLLAEMIAKALFSDLTQVAFNIPFTESKWVAYLNQHAHVLSQNYSANGTQLTAEVTSTDRQRLAKYVVKQ